MLNSYKNNAINVANLIMSDLLTYCNWGSVKHGTYIKVKSFL